MEINKVLKKLLFLEASLLIACAGWRGVTLARSAQRKAEHRTFHHGRWRDSTEEERKGALTSIRRQLEAFQRDDFSQATFYQSSTLRRNFSSPEFFRQMMRDAYPQFLRWKAISFGAVRTHSKSRKMAVQVAVTGADGVTVHAVYLMAPEEGVYRVESVLGGFPPRGDPSTAIEPGAYRADALTPLIPRLEPPSKRRSSTEAPAPLAGPPL